MNRDLGSKYKPKSPVDAWNKAHGKDTVSMAVAKALQNTTIEVTSKQNDEIADKLVEVVGNMLQKDMQDYINKLQKK
jgi:hypothetical protein